MKVCKRSIFSVILIMSTILAEKNEQERVEVKPKDWYSEWVKSQDKPYVRTRVIEGKSLFILPETVCKCQVAKISEERTGIVDSQPRGRFLDSHSGMNMQN